MSPAAAKFLPGTDTVSTKVTALSGLRLVYYRVYHRDGAIATKRPAYLNDIYIGCIKSKWVAPPHTADSLRLCLSSMENIDPTKTKLFASASSQSALADKSPVPLKNNQTLGIIPEAPVLLFSETMPEAGMQAGTENLLVAPDSESPLAPRFLFYGVYCEAGVRASKVPIDAEEPWVSKINLDDIPPPLSVTSLLHILKMKEGIKTFSFCQFFAQNGLSPLGSIFTKDGNSLGSSAEEHLVFKFAIRLPFAEGFKCRIRSHHTGSFLGIQNASSKKVEIYPYASGVNIDCTIFTLKNQDDGVVAFRAVHSGLWVAPNCGTSETEQGFSFIPTEHKDYFYISQDDPVFPKAFHHDFEIITNSYPLQLKALNTADTSQLWFLMPVAG